VAAGAAVPASEHAAIGEAAAMKTMQIVLALIVSNPGPSPLTGQKAAS
jgi:hypothetical protein